ncbi:MAG: hypothetical protein SFU91_03850 [Chloroherpetonaceae bacterium]|nr:hypothetical protein [Chloroherpetonaceae bacterium]
MNPYYGNPWEKDIDGYKLVGGAIRAAAISILGNLALYVIFHFFGNFPPAILAASETEAIDPFRIILASFLPIPLATGIFAFAIQFLPSPRVAFFGAISLLLLVSFLAPLLLLSLSVTDFLKMISFHFLTFASVVWGLGFYPLRKKN